MQLRLIRFDLLVLLFASLINVETLEKLSSVAPLTRNLRAMPVQQVSTSFWANDAKIFETPETHEFVTQVNPEGRRNLRSRRVPVGRHVFQMINSSPSYSTILSAEKLAQDALHSKEMLDKIKKLTSINDDENLKHQETLKEIEKDSELTTTSHTAVAETTAKSEGHKKHKDQENRKHHKHKKRGKKHKHPKHRLKRQHSKKEFSKTGFKRKSVKSLSRERRRGLKGKCSSEISVTCRRKRNHQMPRTKKTSDNISGENFKPFINEDKYSNFKSKDRNYGNISSFEQGEKNNDVIYRKRSHLLARLMLTTTSDPTKKKLGDQGVEYSEYYSDNENILSPDVMDQSKLHDAAKTLMVAQARSVRETGDEHHLGQQYYDSLDEQLLNQDGERSKRNGEKFVKVMEEPSNSMEYIDNTYEPARANEMIDNARMSEYLSNFNYIPDQRARRQKPPRYNQISSNGNPIVNQNLPVIESLQNKSPLNMIPYVNANPIINFAHSPGPGQAVPFGNIVLSQLPRHDEGNKLQHYSIKETPFQHSTVSSTDPIAFFMPTSPQETMKSLVDIGVNIPDTDEPPRQYPAASFVTSSSISGFSPTIPSDNFGAALPRAVLETFRMTPSPIDLGSTFVDYSELSSRFRDIGPGVSPLEFRYSNAKAGVQNTQSPDKVEPIAPREMAMENMPVGKGKKKSFNVTKKDEQTTATMSKINHVQDQDAGNEATSREDRNLGSVTVQSSSHGPEKTTLAINETKAVANEILNEIVQELEVLKLESPKNEQREGLPCKLTGSWVTARAGVRIDMNVTNHSIHISLDNLTPPIVTEGLLNITWNVTGFAPFKRGDPFTLLATNNHTKSLAVFVGACKVCQGIDTIEGIWTVSREPRDCRDFQMSINIFNEIFRRTRLYSEIKDKQTKNETQTLSSTTVTAASSNGSTSENGSVTTHKVPDHLEKSQKISNQSLESNDSA